MLTLVVSLLLVCGLNIKLVLNLMILHLMFNVGVDCECHLGGDIGVNVGVNVVVECDVGVAFCVGVKVDVDFGVDVAFGFGAE